MKKLYLVLVIFLLVFPVEIFSQLGNKNMDLLSNLNNHVTPYSAVWGYVANSREYAILGCFDGTSFVDITDANNIHQVGFVISTSPGNGYNLWREMKTYSHYAYIVSEVGGSGIQIVDLQYLPDSVHYIKKFLPPGYSSTHSISQSGPYLYVNGASIGQGVTIFDLTTDPENPVMKGSYNNDYIHDCRIVNDTIYAANIYIGRVSIINAVNKNSLNLVKSFSNLPGSGPHNTALTPDRRYLLVTDEIGNAPYLLKFWDIQDVDNPLYITSWQPTGITTSIVHNVEVYGNYALAAHYTAGIRVVEISNPGSPVEVAWYDTYPSDDNTSYEGCWGGYMFPSGKIAASDRSTGLYVLKLTFNINVAVEGYYNSATDELNLKDTVRAYLRNSVTPYNIADSSIAVIDSVMLGNFKFNNAPAGTYYIVMKHRSSIEIWSKAGGEFYNPMMLAEYNFTTSDTQAFGGNQAQVDLAPVKYAMYSGDTNQDGTIDVKDLILIYYDTRNSNTGYLSTDINGDYTVDVTDLLITYNNIASVICVITP